jgi:hypothetical protein
VKGRGRIVAMPDYEADFHGGDEADFTARPWTTSSTAC